MITLFHFVRLSMLNLRRGGQRVIVALLCIAFGIMVLVSMSMIAKSIESTLLVEPAQLLGGDLSMGRETEDTILPEHVDQLKALQQSGEISQYTLIAFNNTSIMFHAAGSGEMHFVGNGMGIEPDKYPLAGTLDIGEPGSTGLPTLLRQVGDVIITRDIAIGDNLKVGDRIVLSDLRIGMPVECTIRAIANDTPNHQGDKLYYTLETAQKLANGQAVVNTIIANTTHAKTVSEKLSSSGWSVDWAAGRRDKQTANAWIIGLRGAGILGLLVGGIGIANTMQVLLRRRQREIAIWKTLGYREGHLRLIFSLEAGLLGLAGSVLGAGLGVLISGQVLELLRRTSTVLYGWTFSPAPPLLGILVGTLTTVIFAYWAIVVTSQARPMALLRNEPIDVRRLPRLQSVALGLLLAAPFIALISLVMESVIAGIGVLIFLVSGIAVLGGFFNGVLWVCTRVLPTHGFPLARMAFSSLRRRGAALVFAMIALFVGVLSMSSGLAVSQVSERRIAGQSVDFQGPNLSILAPADQESAIRRAIEAHNPQRVSVGYRTALEGLSVSADGVSPGDCNSTPDRSERPVRCAVGSTDAVLVGRSDPQDYAVSGAAWGSQPDGVYAYKWANLKAGSQVEATFRDGTTKTFTVVGSYDVNYRSIYLYPPTGLLMTAQGFTQVTRPDSLTFFVQFEPSQIGSVATALATALPQATVVDLIAYAGRFMQSYQKLYVLPIVMAGLALLAGILLVANSVSLAMLDRRYEIGILKTVGYTRGQILTLFAVEYGLVGLLATGAGVLLVQGLLAVLAIANHLAASVLLLNFQSLAIIAFCGVGLTLLTVVGVTWEPTRVSPVAVLNERN
jgi:putative ABC transport system permease protein